MRKKETNHQSVMSASATLTWWNEPFSYIYAHTCCQLSFVKVIRKRRKRKRTSKHARSYLEISQSLDVEHSSEYCLAMAIGARHTLDPLAADTSQTSPASQSASRRHSSPNLRPYKNRHFPITEIKKRFFLNVVYILLLHCLHIALWRWRNYFKKVFQYTKLFQIYHRSL